MMALLYGVLSRISSLLPGFRKKKTTIETLEYLDKVNERLINETQIKDYEKYKQANETNERKYIGALVLYSILFYVMVAGIYYIYLMPKNILDRIKTLVPFFITPLLIYGTRKFLKWFFVKRTANYEKKLNDLKEEKKCILEEVKEKETYKKAKEILERFANGIDINITPPTSPLNQSRMPMTPYLNQTLMVNGVRGAAGMPPNSALIHRNVRQLQHQQHQQQQLNATALASSSNDTSQLNCTAATVTNASTAAAAAAARVGNSAANTSIMSNASGGQSSSSWALPAPPSLSALPPHLHTGGNMAARTMLPRPIIASNRSFFDRVLDFVMCDGPNNRLLHARWLFLHRYALICKSCHLHNGMAVKEEFEYIAFRCAYCLFYNEARKNKLTVPKKLSDAASSSNGRRGLEMTTQAPMEHNENESIGSSTLSSSNSFDDINNLSEPISSSSVPAASSGSNRNSNSHASNDCSVLKTAASSNMGLNVRRKNSLNEMTSSAIVVGSSTSNGSNSNSNSNINNKNNAPLLMNRRSSKSMEKLSASEGRLRRNTDRENKENSERDPYEESDYDMVEASKLTNESD